LTHRARRSALLLVGADPDDLAFVANATTAVNTVLASLDFAPGDEILTTDHDYVGCRNVLRRAAERCGARVVVASVPFPLKNADEVVDAVLSETTPRTRFAMLDHVTSATGLVFPVERLVAELEARGVACLIDGAHAPGMLPLDLRRLGASYYAATSPKWMCAPKGAGLLWARPTGGTSLRPIVAGVGANSARTDRPKFRLEFDWSGTTDPSPYLCVPDAIRFLLGPPARRSAGADERETAREALAMRSRLAARLGVGRSLSRRHDRRARIARAAGRSAGFAARRLVSQRAVGAARGPSRHPGFRVPLADVASPPRADLRADLTLGRGLRASRRRPRNGTRRGAGAMRLPLFWWTHSPRPQASASQCSGTRTT